MKAMSRCEDAWDRRLRNVFSAKGQPQWRRKWITRGLPLVIGRLEIDGAWEPMEGGEEVGTVEGVSHDLSSCWYVMMNVERLRDLTRDGMAVREGAIVKMPERMNLRKT